MKTGVSPRLAKWLEPNRAPEIGEPPGAEQVDLQPHLRDTPRLADGLRELTKRERGVMARLVEGKTDREIAALE